MILEELYVFVLMVGSRILVLSILMIDFSIEDDDFEVVN